MKGYIFFSIFCASLGVAVSQENDPRFRLPNNAIPNSYDIKIQPNITNGSFRGEVLIYVELQHSLKFITLNIKDLVVESLVLDSYMDQTKYRIQKEFELIHIYHADVPYIDPGEHMIYVKYTGVMRSDSTGFFKSIVQSEGKKFLSAATMFSAPYARTTFPCFDEPSYKSRFNIRLIEPDATFTALSNMEKIGSFEVKDGTAVDFQTTPSISPYIVCFVFTQYKYKSSEYVSRDGRVIPLRFFLLDEYLDQAPFMLEVARQALQFFEEYTNVTYPISKLDFIEVPHFIFEGMENIGLVILTHNAISYNASSDISKVEHLRYAAQLVVHEISHMWFGNIVTPKWYNDLWLAEGFAQLMQTKGLVPQYPQWQLVAMEGPLRSESIFYNDNAQIVKFPENHDQVEDQFSDIIYVKGCAVLRMLEMAMGEDEFKIGVRRLMKTFYMDSATTGDLIGAMQSVTPLLNLRGFLESWLHQDRFPLLTVSRDVNTKGYILRQRSLVVEPNTSSIFGRRWTIPVTFISSCNKSLGVNWFDRDAKELKIPSCGEKWIKFNHRDRGYYRVLYSKEQYEQLINNFDDLEEADQANLLEESYHLVSAQLISCDIPLKFMGKLRNKEGLSPSLTSFRVIQRMITIFQRNRSAYEKLRKYFIDNFKGLYEKLKWKVSVDDGHTVRLLRSKLIAAMCLPPISYEKCLGDAEKANGEDGKIHPDVSYVWKRLVNAETRKTKQVAGGMILGNNSTSSPGVNKSSTELYIEKCMSWIKLNL